MRIKLAWAGIFLALSALAVATDSAFGAGSPLKLEGVINDFSPRSTTPTGPYLVSGPWNLQLHPNGKAEFFAALTMVRSDLWFVDTGGDPDSQTDRNFHTHHVRVAAGEVSIVGSAIVVSGPAAVTSNGNAVFPGSTVQVEITGGNSVAPSNLKLIFNGPVAAHFTSQPYEGVVVR